MKTIGKTSSGKPIYAAFQFHRSFDHWTANDHADAAEAHRDAVKSDIKTNRSMHENSAALHDEEIRRIHGLVEKLGLGRRHHARRKPPAQLQREIDEALATPAWAKGLDLSESRALAKRLHVSQEELEAKERRIESDRRAALPSLAITDAGNGIFVRVSSPGPGYGKYRAVVDALKAFQIPIGNAIPPNIFVPVHKAADKTKARTKLEEALRYAGYRA